MIFLRFLCSGGFNTAVTYALYLVALSIMPYWAAYTTTYIIGIALAYIIGRYWVFRQHRGKATVILLPIVYIVQYLIGMMIVWLWVSRLGFPAQWAPLAAIAVTVPITYLLSKQVFTRNKAGR